MEFKIKATNEAKGMYAFFGVSSLSELFDKEELDVKVDEQSESGEMMLMVEGEGKMALAILRQDEEEAYELYSFVFRLIDKEDDVDMECVC